MAYLSVHTPADFSFARTILSHGWLVLPPFHYDESTQTVSRVEQLRDGVLAHFHMRAGQSAIDVELDDHSHLTSQQNTEVIHIVRRCMALDWDMRAFYDAMRAYPQYAWVEEKRAGRLLVGPTVWEDLAKTLMTTNTTWAQTKGMCKRLCELGAPYAEGRYAFPTPQQIYAMSQEELHARVRAGYRSAYLHELAGKIVRAEVDVEAWHGDHISSDDLYKAIRGLTGFGDYAAGTMLRLLGRFDRIAIDTVCRNAHAQIYNGGVKADDKTIRATYEPFGKWRGLVMWMDIIRDDP